MPSSRNNSLAAIFKRKLSGQPLYRSCKRMLRICFPRRKRHWTQMYQVGTGTYGEPEVMHWGEPATLRVGKYCSIAVEVRIFLGGNHRTDWVTTYPFSFFNSKHQEILGHPATKGDVNIGNDVWIGQKATILSGVTVGNGAVIGTCALVTKDVPAYAIVGGNPAKLIRYRFPESDIQMLEQLAWWDWDPEKIDAAIPLLLSCDLRGLQAFDLRLREAQRGLGAVLKAA